MNQQQVQQWHVKARALAELYISARYYEKLGTRRANAEDCLRRLMEHLDTDPSRDAPASVGRERHAARRRFWSSGGPCGLERTKMKRAASPCLLLLAACGGGGGDSPEAVSAAGPAPAAAPQRPHL